MRDGKGNEESGIFVTVEIEIKLSIEYFFLETIEFQYYMKLFLLFGRSNTVNQSINFFILQNIW